MTPGEEQQLGNVSWNFLWVAHHEAQLRQELFSFGEEQPVSALMSGWCWCRWGLRMQACGWSPGRGSWVLFKVKKKSPGKHDQAAVVQWTRQRVMTFPLNPCLVVSLLWGKPKCRRLTAEQWLAAQHPAGCTWAARLPALSETGSWESEKLRGWK